MTLDEKLLDADITQRTTLKVVQIFIDDIPHLWFGNTNEFHSHILKSGLSELGITAYEEIDGLYGKIPALAGDRYRVVGMCQVTLYKCKKSVFYSNSADYSIGANSEHLELMKNLYP